MEVDMRTESTYRWSPNKPGLPFSSLHGNFPTPVHAAAEARAQQYGPLYAKAKSPVSPNPSITGNSYPDQTPLSWLKGRSKCNQFVGDVLFQAGYEVPTSTMRDGSKHYVLAEKFKASSAYFRRIEQSSEIRVGDVVIFDWKNKSGPGGAHAEIITAIDHVRRSLTLIGARAEGASAKANRRLYHLLQTQSGAPFESGTAEIHFLRPVRRRRS